MNPQEFQTRSIKQKSNAQEVWNVDKRHFRTSVVKTLLNIMPIHTELTDMNRYFGNAQILWLKYFYALDEFTVEQKPLSQMHYGGSSGKQSKQQNSVGLRHVDSLDGLRKRWNMGGANTPCFHVYTTKSSWSVRLVWHQPTTPEALGSVNFSSCKRFCCQCVNINLLPHLQLSV